MLNDSNIPVSRVSGLEECFEQHKNPFVGLETQYLQYQYYKKNFDLKVRTYCMHINIFVKN